MSMKRKPTDREIISALEASRQAADARFVNSLKQKLFAEAQESLGSSCISIYQLILNSMKRYSFAYTAGLLILAMGGILLLPKGMDPEEFLAKASEAYSGNGIFHEKTLRQSFENEIVVETSLQEIYFDDLGNFLFLIKNPDTEEILQASLDTADGSTYEPSDWYESLGSDQFAGSKIICVKFEQAGDQIIEVDLKINEENHSIYALSGSSEEISEDDYLNQLLHEDPSLSTAQKILEKLQEDKEYTFSMVSEDGKTYAVFQEEPDPETADPTHQVAWYFDTETYKLGKVKLTGTDQPNHVEVTSYLENAYREDLNATELFDPRKYEVVSVERNTAGIPAYIEENGCYFDGEKLSQTDEEALLNELPKNALEERDLLLEEIIKDLTELNGFEADSKE